MIRLWEGEGVRASWSVRAGRREGKFGVPAVQVRGKAGVLCLGETAKPGRLCLYVGVKPWSLKRHMHGSPSGASAKRVHGCAQVVS